MFFYDWSNINRYSHTTMQHVTAVKIGGGQVLYDEVTIQYNIVSFQHRTQHQQFVPSIGIVGKGVDRRIILLWSTTGN